MSRLRPMEKLDNDYYVGEQWREGADSDEEMSSDDELQQELRKLAGVRRECQLEDGKEQEQGGSRQCRRSEFEDDMENELDRSISDYAITHMTSDGAAPVTVEELPADVPMEDDEDMPALEPSGGVEEENTPMSTDAPPVTKKEEEKPKSPLKSCLKKEKIEEKEEEKEENPIKKLAKEREKQMKQEALDFYDAEEDDENEKWVQEQRKTKKGKKEEKEGVKKEAGSRPRIDDGSDAVLSCPGCMILLSRDCQRHELYNDQYRAMFVENCVVDDAEKLTIEKSGKEKRKERQRLRKLGIDKAQTAADDIFLPVTCRVCKTHIAVMDQDEVYHFFNVLAGYA